MRIGEEEAQQAVKCVIQHFTNYACAVALECRKDVKVALRSCLKSLWNIL